MPSQERTPTRHRARVPATPGGVLALPARIVVPAALALVTVIVLLVLLLISINSVLASLRQANGRLHVTNTGVGALNRKVQPVAGLTPAVLRRAGAQVEQTRSTIENISTATRAVAGATVPLAAQVRAARLPDVLGRLQRLDLLGTADRALRDVPRLTATLAVADGHILELRQTLQAALDTLAASRRVQCLTLEHIESVDRKTGGPVTGGGPAGSPYPPPECRDAGS